MPKPFYILVTPFFPSPISWRGAFCYHLAKAIARTGKYDIRVFVLGAGEDYVYQGMKVYRFPVKHLPSAIFPFLFKRTNEKSFLKKLSVANISPSDVAICNGHTAFCAIYPLALRKINPSVKTFLHHHDPQSFGLNLGRLRHVWLHKVINFILLRRLHEQIDCHVFISEIVRKSFLSVPDASWTVYEDYKKQMKGLGFFHGPHISRSVILHNAVDCNVFSSNGRVGHKGFVVGIVGNFIDRKDHITLLMALNKIKNELGDWELRLIGSGPLLNKCKQYVKENGLESNVSFEAEVDYTELPDFYRSLDLFVLPSYFEGFGCVFTEAFACGTPFITCYGQGMDDLILFEERKLWLVEPRNPTDLAEKILYYYNHRPRQHMSQSINIDEWVNGFIKQIEKMKCE